MRIINLAAGLLLANFLTNINVAQAATPMPNPGAEPIVQQVLAQNLAVINAALQANPNNIAMIQQRIILYKLMKQPEKAQADFDKLISLAPNQAEKNSLLSFKAIYYEQYAEARTYIDNAIVADPTNPDYYARKAEILNQLNQPADALAAANKAIELNPKSASAFYARSKAYEKLGETSKAQADLAMADKLKAEAEGNSKSQTPANELPPGQTDPTAQPGQAINSSNASTPTAPAQ